VHVKEACKFYRLVKATERGLIRQIMPYDVVDLQKGELALCNTMEWHEALLDQMDDDDRALFMDKTLSAWRGAKTFLGSAVTAGAAGTLEMMVEHIDQFQDVFSMSALGMGNMAAAGSLTAMAWWYYMERNQGSDAFRYCKIIRVGKRYETEKIGRPGRRWAQTKVALTAVSIAKLLPLFLEWSDGTKTQIGSYQNDTINFMPWEEVQTNMTNSSTNMTDTSVMETTEQFLQKASQYGGVGPEPLESASASILASVVTASLVTGAAALVGWGVYKRNERLFGTDIVDFGYALSRNLSHNKDTQPDALTKWKLHQAVLDGIFSKAPKMEKGMYMPQANENTMKFLTPAMVEGRAARTDFALHF